MSDKSKPNYWEPLAKEITQTCTGEALIDAISSSLWTAYITGQTDSQNQLREDIKALADKYELTCEDNDSE